MTLGSGHCFYIHPSSCNGNNNYIDLTSENYENINSPGNSKSKYTFTVKEIEYYQIRD